MTRPALAALLLAGCAAPAAVSTPGQPHTVRVVGPTGGLTTLATSPGEEFGRRRVARAAERVWSALPAVYAGLAIPVAQRDDGARLLGNPGLRLRRQLGGVPLTRYLDCGRAQGGPSAETYEVTLAVATRVEADGEGASVVSTGVQATARPVNFAGGEVRCASTGALEARIAGALTGG